MGTFNFVFQPVGAFAPPWILGPDRVTGVWDFAGAPVAPFEVRLEGGAFVGLNTDRRARIEFGAPSVSVRASLVRFADFPTLEAYNPLGVRVAAATMTAAQATVETLELRAPPGEVINAIEVRAPSGETLLLAYCRHED